MQSNISIKEVASEINSSFFVGKCKCNILKKYGHKYHK
jgi:hypothetical protein